MKTTTKRRPAARAAEQTSEIDAFRAQHLALAEHVIITEFGARSVTVDEAEARWHGWRAAAAAMASR